LGMVEKSNTDENIRDTEVILCQKMNKGF